MLNRTSVIDVRRASRFGRLLAGTLLGIIAINAYADFGSKHADIRKRSRQGQIQEPVATDFTAMEETVGALATGAVEQTLGGHVSQADLDSLSPFEAYVVAFEEGDELFEINYNALDGAGVNVGNGQRFTSVPRPDLLGPNEWANVQPPRITGPNGDSCISCHNVPVADGGGGVNDNVIRIDPERRQKGFIERQAPHIFGMGAVQLLAQEMTTELQGAQSQAITEACASGKTRRLALSSKNVSFGEIRVSCDNINYRQLEGIDEDLVVKPFEWKGLTAFARDFVRGAAHQELGLQATEIVGDLDGDFDRIENELSVGDITALTIYNAAQARPVTRLELDQITAYLSAEEQEQYGLPLSDTEVQSINRGEQLFARMQCTDCHTPSMTAASPTFSEPSAHPEFRDETFPAGNSVSLPETAIVFDITTDILDNQAILPSIVTIKRIIHAIGIY